MVVPTKKAIQSGNLLPYQSNKFETRIEGLTGAIQIILTASKMIGKQENYPTAVRSITTPYLTHVPMPLITLKEESKENNHGKKTHAGKPSALSKQ
jgi:hypothetical protein